MAVVADHVVCGGASRGVYQRPLVTGEHTFSVWVMLISGDGAFSLNHYDGAASNPAAFVATGTWQRFSITRTAVGATYENFAFMKGGGQTAAGVFAVWGAQLEPGSQATAYEQTTGSVGSKNLYLYSEQLDNAAWFKFGSTPATVTADQSEEPQLSFIIAGAASGAGSAQAEMSSNSSVLTGDLAGVGSVALDAKTARPASGGCSGAGAAAAIALGGSFWQALAPSPETWAPAPVSPATWTQGPAPQAWS